MKRILSSLTVLSLFIINSFAGAIPSDTLSGNITSNVTLTKNKVWFLKGYVYVTNDAVITIEPGTIIKGKSGTKATLIIERGSKLIANGTEQLPIIFTSDQSKGNRTYGDWGGIVLCGKSLTNKSDGGSAGTGIAEGGIGSIYGGTDPADSSGVLRYVRIEFPGIALSATANSEINGLTLYAVGSKTVIENVQVSFSGDDSYEWFGGTVNCKKIIAFRGWDDDFDADNGYSGLVQFGVSLRDPAIADQSKSNGFESDNDATGTTTTPITKALYCNMSLIGPRIDGTNTYNSLYSRAMHIRRSSNISIYNSVFAGWNVGLALDSKLGTTHDSATANVLQIENTVLSGMKTNFDNADGPSTDSLFSENYFINASRNNTIYANNSDLMLTDAFNLTNPNFLPQVGSPLLTGASFSNSRLAAFEAVTFRGAFGSTDWTANWANFDPQNTDYDSLFSVVNSTYEVKMKNDFVVSTFPNPVTNNLNVSGKNISEVELVNISGQVIKHISNINAETVIVNMNDVNTGMYFVKVKSKSGVVKTTKIIKN